MVNDKDGIVAEVTKLREEFDALEAEITSTDRWWMVQMPDRAPKVYEQYAQHKRRRREIHRLMVELASVIPFTEKVRGGK